MSQIFYKRSTNVAQIRQQIAVGRRLADDGTQNTGGNPGIALLYVRDYVGDGIAVDGQRHPLAGTDSRNDVSRAVT